MIRDIEEISMNSWPALETVHYDGWVLRFAKGFTKRSNSVNPIFDSALDIDAKIEFCENLYRSKNLPVSFKISDIVQPINLDQHLDHLGYKHEFDISVQVLDIRNLDKILDKDICVASDLDHVWMESFIRMNEMDQSVKPILKDIIEKIKTPKCLLSLKLDDSIIGCGLGVIEKKFIGLFDIVIDQHYRNMGLGQKMVNNILKWGRSMGAETGYLQVLANNEPAIRMYAKLGFSEEYSYWYRIKN